MRVWLCVYDWCGVSFATGSKQGAAAAYRTYLSRNLRWKSLRVVSLMKRFSYLGSSRLWFLNTVSSYHLRHTHVRVRVSLSRGRACERASERTSS